MTLVNSTNIQGCGHERHFAYTIVDLKEPERIGQHPNHKDQFCFETPLERNVKLAVQVSDGTEIVDNHKIAKIQINCPATDCQFHTK